VNVDKLTVTELDAELDRKEFIRAFLLQVLLGVEGSYSREYLDAVISDAAYAWDKTERI